MLEWTTRNPASLLREAETSGTASGNVLSGSVQSPLTGSSPNIKKSGTNVQKYSRPDTKNSHPLKLRPICQTVVSDDLASNQIKLQSYIGQRVMEKREKDAQVGAVLCADWLSL